MKVKRKELRTVTVTEKPKNWLFIILQTFIDVVFNTANKLLYAVLGCKEKATSNGYELIATFSTYLYSSHLNGA